MAIQRIPILGWATIPAIGGGFDSAGECFFQPYSVLATTDQFPRQIVRFGLSNVAQPTIPIGLHGGFTVPKNYVWDAQVVLIWTATITTGAVTWQFFYQTIDGNDVNSLDGVAHDNAGGTVDNAPGAAHRRLECLVNVTDADFQPDDEVNFIIYRAGTDANDTMAGSAILFNALFQYQDA
jgi:hypothetical protein